VKVLRALSEYTGLPGGLRTLYTGGQVTPAEVFGQHLQVTGGLNPVAAGDAESQAGTQGPEGAGG